MAKIIKDAVYGLCTVKSIITFLLVLVFSYLTVVGRVSENNFMTIFSTVIAFYYGTQYRKGGETNNDKSRV